MSLETAFLEDIQQHPEDDTPRLIYADWLSEHGDASSAARGEFIRAQCRLARLAEDDPERAELEDHLEALELGWRSTWIGLANPGASLTFRRGFVEEAQVTVDQLAAVEERLMRESTLQAMSVSVNPDGAGRLLVSPLLRRLRRLNLSFNDLSDRDAQQLAECDRLAGLAELDVSHNDIGDWGAQALLRSPYLQGLTALHLAFNHRVSDATVRGLAIEVWLPALTAIEVGFCSLTAAGGLALATSRLQTPLHSLGLERCRLGDGEVQELLADSPHTPHLRSLSLGRNDISYAGVRALVACRGLTQLARLDLTGNALGDNGAIALASASNFSLQELHLDEAAITAAGIETLAASRALSHLTTLSLGENPLGAAGARALANSPFLRSLKELLLYRTGVGDEGASVLADSPVLARLSFLQLAQNQIGAEGARALASSPHLRNLRVLRLEENDLGDTGVEALAASPGLTRLTWLCLESNGITDRGAVALATSPHLDRLRTLSLGHNSIGSEGARVLRDRFGDRVEL